VRPFTTLVKLFLQQMIRSKALWLISGLLLAMILLINYYQSQFREFLGNGMTYEIATQKVIGNLKNIVLQIKSYGVVFIIIISALVAPASRKNGTTQFVLSMQITRFELASAQFSALALFVCAAVLIIHVGFSIAALRVEFIGISEVALGWITLLLPLLLAAAVSFSLSLTLSSIAVYLILFGGPLLFLPLLDTVMTWKGHWVPVPMARLFDNIGLLFPNPEFLIFWPFLSPNLTVTDPPFPIWTWSIANFGLTVMFWILLSYYYYKNFNIGSRQALK
jgi:ABC-type transport system involved in multi-copper enzyme maturation permease subunit